MKAKERNHCQRLVYGTIQSDTSTEILYNCIPILDDLFCQKCRILRKLVELDNRSIELYMATSQASLVKRILSSMYYLHKKVSLFIFANGKCDRYLNVYCCLLKKQRITYNIDGKMPNSEPYLTVDRRWKVLSTCWLLFWLLIRVTHG